MLPGFKEAYDLYRESGWQGLCYPENLVGQGLPMSLALIQSEILAAANWTFLMFPGDHVCNTSPCARTLAAHLPIEEAKGVSTLAAPLYIDDLAA